MRAIIRILYKYLPKKMIHAVGSSKSLRPLRDAVLRENGHSRTVEVKANWKPENLDFKFKTDLKTSIRAEKRGIESSLLKLSLRLLNYSNGCSNNVILDVGASFGYLSLVWGQTVCRDGKVFSFEANKHVFECLLHNTKVNDLDDIIKVYNQPVYRSSSMITLDNSPSSSYIHQDDSVSFNASSAMKAISVDDFADNESLDKIDLIKIDVDGVELDILKGAALSIEKYRPILIIETNEDPEIPKFLAQFGYEFYDMLMNPVTELPNNLVCISK